MLLVMQHYTIAGLGVDRVDHTSSRTVNSNFSGIAPGIVTMTISPSQVLHSQPFFDSFWT